MSCILSPLIYSNGFWTHVVKIKLKLKLARRVSLFVSFSKTFGSWCEENLFLLNFNLKLVTRTYNVDVSKSTKCIWMSVRDTGGVVWQNARKTWGIEETEMFMAFRKCKLIKWGAGHRNRETEQNDSKELCPPRNRLWST